MATSTVERVREQAELGKENKVVTGKEPEQQIEDEQWEFIRDEVEKMKEARELGSKGTAEAKRRARGKLRNKRLNLKLKESKGFKNSEKRLKIQYYELKGDLMNCNTRKTSVNKVAQQERGDI